MTSCLRCRDTIAHGAPSRFQVRVSDLADSSGTHHQGTLYVDCWDELIDFLDDETAETGEVPA